MMQVMDNANQASANVLNMLGTSTPPRLTPEQFAYWLQGWVELNDGKMPSATQWAAIVEHLNLVFNKVTKVKPEEVKQTTTVTTPDFPDWMKRYQEQGSTPQDQQTYPDYLKYPWTLDVNQFPPGTIIC